jgi:nucleolar protein 16
LLNSIISYTALGLIHSLNPSASGGNEQPSTQRIIEIPAEMPSASRTVNRTIPVGFGKIIRDEAGNILHVELNDTEEESANPTEMEDIQIDSGITTRWVTDLGGHQKDIAVSEKGGQLLESESIYNFEHCFLFAHGHRGHCVFLSVSSAL